MTQGSAGNLTAHELRHADPGERDANGERIVAAEPITEEIIDLTNGQSYPPVTIDGPEMVQAYHRTSG